MVFSKAFESLGKGFMSEKGGDADGDTSKERHIPGSISGSQGTSVFREGNVPYIEKGVFDCPVAANDCQERCWVWV